MIEEPKQEGTIGESAVQRARGLKPLPRGRAIVTRATVEGEVSDVLGNLLDSLNPATPSAPVAAPEAPAAALTPPPAPTPAPAAAPAPPPPPAPAPVPTPQTVVPSQPDLPSIESLAQKVEYPSSKVPVPSPAKAVEGNPLQPFMDALTSAEEAVENAFDDTAEAIINNFSSFSLPPSLQEKLNTINAEYADTKEAFEEAPEVYLFLFVLLFGAIGYTYYRNEFGGFSGIYKPTELVEALTKEENILLVDIRSEEEQEDQGVLDLRRSARTKAVSLPIVEVPDAVKGDVRNQRALQRKLSAALVCSLANVNAFTKIVLMDTRGGTTKPLAREICSQGYRAYILKGGYTLWSRVGLATKMGSYEVTAADLLADKREELAEAATSTAEQLKKPETAALAVLGLVALGTTVAYPHESFQFLGFLGLQITVIVKLLSYERPKDAFAALQQSSRSFADTVGSAASKASDAGAQIKKMSGPAAAASAAVASAASKASEAASSAASKLGNSAEDVKVPEAAAKTPDDVTDKEVEEEKPPTSGSMFVKASADKPAPAAQTSNTPPPSKSSAAAPDVAKEKKPEEEKPAPAKVENKLDALFKAAREAAAEIPAPASASAAKSADKKAPVSVSKLETLGRDMPKPEATKAEAASTPAASTPAMPKPEATKPEPVKAEAIKAEPVKPEAVKPEASKPEPVKTEATKAEPVKPEASKPAPVKTEASKPEPVKTEAVKPEASKPEASKPEPVKTEASKPEPVKTEASKAELEKAEGAKPEPVKTEASKPAGSKAASKLFSAMNDSPAEKDKPVSSVKKDKPSSSAGVGFGMKKATAKKEKREKWPDAVAEAAAEAAAIAQDVPKPVVEIVDDKKKKNDGEKIGNGSTKIDAKSANGSSARDKK